MQSQDCHFKKHLECMQAIQNPFKVPLITIQSPPQIPRPPHQLLILMLLHLQLPLPLNTNRPNRTLLSPLLQKLLIPLLANIHAFAKPCGCGTGLLNLVRAGLGLFDVRDERGAVCHVCHFAVCVGRFFDCEDGFVGPVLGGVCGFGGFGGGGEGGAVHRLRWWGWVEGLVVPG
jgi:hypothetical protein